MTTPFLKEIAADILQKKPDDWVLVFPNRRAGLFFNRYLAELTLKPIIPPVQSTIEDLFQQLGSANYADRLTLIFELFSVYRKFLPASEDFDSFYSWGDMLLSDFDSIDKNLVNPRDVFRVVHNLKEIDAMFDYLTESQRNFLSEFWSSIKIREKANEFLQVWDKLFPVYEAYNKVLEAKGMAYPGMLYRKVGKSEWDSAQLYPGKRIAFIGFNALQTAEKRLILKLLEAGRTEVFWDLDKYYFQDKKQEAGKFLRDYASIRSLSRTFQPNQPDNLVKSKNIYSYAATTFTAQVKKAGELLRSVMEQEDFRPEETVVILPDENMLLPVLHGLPDLTHKLNVTMGYPVKDSPVFAFFLRLLHFQERDIRNDQRIFRSVIREIVTFELFASLQDDSQAKKMKELVDSGQLYFYLHEVKQISPVSEMIFKSVEEDQVPHYLLRIAEFIFEQKDVYESRSLDVELLGFFISRFRQLIELLKVHQLAVSKKFFRKLFLQVGKNLRIPFTGEPLNGVQIMGVFETRLLDFKNVFILGMNEGIFPSVSMGNSYIPFNVRKAFGLPSVDQQDSIFAYLFYRSIQRADNIYLFHKTGSEDVREGEPSRFIHQLNTEFPHTIHSFTIQDEVVIKKAPLDQIEKSEKIMQMLDEYLARGLSPSAINTYIEDPLSFYLKYIARLEQLEDDSDEIDARVFGQLLHLSMEFLYKPYEGKLIQLTDFFSFESAITGSVESAFRKFYQQKDKQSGFPFQGHQLVVKNLLEEYVRRILEIDKRNVPFEIIEVEMNIKLPLILEDGTKIVFKGYIDRVDRVGDTVRLIDYKTGKDDKHFSDVASLFTYQQGRNKAALQTLAYAFLYKHQYPEDGAALCPGLFNGRELFDSAFDHRLIFDKVPVDDARSFLPDYEENLIRLIEDMRNPNKPFTRNPDKELKNEDSVQIIA